MLGSVIRGTKSDTNRHHRHGIADRALVSSAGGVSPTRQKKYQSKFLDHFLELEAVKVHGGNQGRQALLIVDLQRGVIGSCVAQDETLERIRQLAAGARRGGVPVIWVRHHDEADLPSGSDGWHLVDDPTPQPGEPIVDKAYFDAFADTDLEARLKELGVERLLLCGVQTDACIRSTFYGGLYRGYPVTLISDGHTTEDMRQWGLTFAPEAAIAVLNQHASESALPGVSGTVATTAEVLGVLAELAR